MQKEIKTFSGQVKKQQGPNRLFFLNNDSFAKGSRNLKKA